MNRIRRALELASLFGPFDRDFWRTLFPPFKGWDVGCRQCKHCYAAKLAKRCARGRGLDFRQCGESDQ